MFRIIKLFVLMAAISTFMSIHAQAQEDVKDSKDLSIIGRYPGSYITAYHHIDYVEMIFPKTTNTREKKQEFESMTLEGDNKTIVYEVSDTETSALKVFRTYEKTLNKMGFTQHISCSGDKGECGYYFFREFIKGTDRKLQYEDFSYSNLGGVDSKFLLYTGSLKKKDKEYYLIMTVYRGDKVLYILDLLEAQPLGGEEILTPGADATPPAEETPKDSEISAFLDAPAQVKGGTRFNVGWQGLGQPDDRIELISLATNQSVMQTSPRQGNPLQYTAPEEPGDYRLRYIDQEGRELAGRPIKIIPAELPPGFLKVTASQQPQGDQNLQNSILSSIRSSSAITKNAGVEIILDASGSMLKRIDNQRRIDIAKHTLIDLINNVIPPDTPFAFRVFGQKETETCQSNLEIDLTPLDPAAATLAVTGVNVMNKAKTPIGDALAKVSSDMEGVAGKRIVILLTDGEETCGGDPAAAIKALRADNTEVRVNIIGFALDNEALHQTFKSWAKLGNGSYFSAENADQLSEALKQSVQIQYEVLDASGKIIGRGSVDGAEISLPSGTYRVRMNDQHNRLVTVEVKPEQTSEVAVEI